MNTQELRVLNPVASANIKDQGGATRFEDFSGKRIGLWWNGKPNGDIFLNEIAHELEARFQGITTVRMWEIDPATTSAYGISTSQLEVLANSADLVIGGLAD
jgi:hypothetical protein